MALTTPSKLPSTGTSIFTVMSRLAQEHGAINLSQGFPDFDCDPELIEAVARHMRAGHNQYAHSAGLPALRAAISSKIERAYGRRYDPETEIVVTAGATEALYATLTSLVHPGDEVVILEPAYDSYVPAVMLSGGVPRFVTMQPPDYRVDWDAVRQSVSLRTRVILVNSPHNPTGTVLSADDLRQLEHIVESSDAVVVSDEVYEHIIFDGRRHESVARSPRLAERAVVISSFGKTYHTTGWKVGYLAAPRSLAAEVQRIHQFVTFSVSTPVQHAFAEFVARDPLSESLPAFYQRKRDHFLSLVGDSRFTALPCEGTYFQLLDYSAVSREPDTLFAERLLKEHGIASIPLTPFLQQPNPAPVLRFCFAKREQTLERAAERLRAV